MSNFNYSRFGITFRWIERYSRNTMIRVLFLALAVYLFILLMNTVTASYKGIPADMQQLTLIRAIRSCGMAYFFWVIISGTWFCQNIKTKQQRITVKMLPATALEKFLSHMAWLAIQLIGMALMFCLADVIRVALFAALGLDWIQMGHPCVLQHKPRGRRHVHPWRQVGSRLCGMCGMAAVGTVALCSRKHIAKPLQ